MKTRNSASNHSSRPIVEFLRMFVGTMVSGNAPQLVRVKNICLS